MPHEVNRAFCSQKNCFTRVKAESREEYLEAIYRLKRQRGMIRSVDLAHDMGYSKASISRAVAKLCISDLLLVDSEGFLELTDEGEAVGRSSYTKHVFFKELLAAAGVPPEQAECEACRMGHVISDDSFRLLCDLCSSQGGWAHAIQAVPRRSAS